MVGRLPYQQDPNESPILAALRGAATGVGQAAQAISLPGEIVKGAIAPIVGPGGHLLDLPTLPIPGQGPRFNFSPGRVAEAQAAIQKMRQGGVGAAFSPEMARSGLSDQSTPNRLAFEFGTDPLSYVGLGIPGKMAASGKYGARMVRALQYSQYLDNALAEAPSALVKTSIKPVRGLLKAIPAPGLKVYNENQIPRAASSLHDWATALSRQGWYKLMIRKAANTAQTLRDSGRKLQVDIVNEQMLQQERDRIAEANKTGQFLNYENDLRPSMNQLFGALRENLARTQDPTEKAWKYEMMRAIEQAHQDVWSETWAKLQGIRGKKAVNKTTGKQYVKYSDQDWARISQEVQDAYYKSFSLLSSGLAHMEHMAPKELANLRISTAPGSDQAVRDAIDRAMMSVDRIVQTGGRRNVQYGNQGSVFTGGQAAKNYLLRNTQTNAAYQAGSDQLAKMIGGYESILGFPRERTAQLLQEAQDVRNGVPIISRYLPEELRTFVGKEWHNFQTHASNLAQDRNTILETLRTAWSENPNTKSIPFPIKDSGLSTSNPDTRWPAINDLLKRMGRPEVDPETGGLPALRESLAPEMNAHPNLYNKWETIMQHWKEGDPISADPYEVVVDRIARDKAPVYGVKPPPRGSLQDYANLGLNLWKEVNLLAPSQPITNLIGGLVASHIAGVSPRVILNNLGYNMDAILHGGEVTNSEWRHTLQSLGVTGPAGLNQTSGTILGQTPQKTLLGVNLSASQRVGTLGMAGIGAAYGGASGAMQDDTNNRGLAIAHGILVGGAIGASIPTLSRILLRNIGGGIEQVMRQSVINKTVVDDLLRPGGGIDATVEAALRSQSSPVRAKQITRIAPSTGMRSVQTVPVSSVSPDKLVAALDKTFEARGGLPSVNDVNQSLIKAGLDPEQAVLIGQVWNDRIYQAMQKGMQAVNTVHVDYEVLNNAERFARTAMPFSTWSVRMFPFFAKHILENPQILMSLAALNRLSQDDIEQKGLTQRFAGSVHLGLGDAIFSAILGHPVKNFYNPLIGFVPFASAERGIDRAVQQAGEGQIIPAVLSGLGAVGLGIRPDIALGARFLDPTGEMPTQGYMRQAAPLQGAEALAGLNQGKGYDLNAGATELESKIRGVIHGQEPVDLRQAAVLRRIDELALRDTGEPISSGTAATAPYVAAKASLSGPIYDQASSEMAKESGLRSLFGFFSQMLAPQAMLNQQEEQIRGSQAEHRQANEEAGIAPVRDELSSLVQAGKEDQPAPGELVRKVHALVNPAEYDKNGAEQIRTLYEIGTVRALQKIMDGAFPRPADASQGYQSGGSPLETQLANQMDVYQNPAAIVAMQGGDPAQVAAQWQSYQNADPALRQAMESNRFSGVQNAYNLKDQYKSGAPLLNAYLGWQQQQGHRGRQKDFINELLRQRSLMGRVSSAGR